VRHATARVQRAFVGRPPQSAVERREVRLEIARAVLLCYTRRVDPQSYYRCWVEVDLDAIRHNVAAIRRRIGSAKLMAVVKADAYGHGLAPVARTLMQCGVDAFPVANLAE